MDLKSKFCAKCGKHSKLIDNLCPECFLEEHPVKIPRKTSIRYCTKCGSVWFEGLWIKASKSVENYLLQRAVDRIKLPEEAELVKAEILKTGSQGELKLTLKLGEVKLIKKYKTQLIVEKYCCPECSRERATSWLAILQLRTDKDVDNFVKEASKLAHNKSQYIVKAEEHKQGIDLFISNKDVAMLLAKEIKDKLNCRMKQSAKQYGWDRIRNKPLTRLTVLLREKC